MINNLLFVYGSLLNPGNEFASYLNSNSTIYAAGKIKGILYDIGEFPGVIIHTRNDYNITGIILQLNNPEDNLNVLDDYEGFGEDQEQPNLFIRKLLPVETSSGPITCWVYLYNLSVDGLEQITSGNYLKYLKKRHKKSDG